VEKSLETWLPMYVLHPLQMERLRIKSWRLSKQKKADQRSSTVSTCRRTRLVSEITAKDNGEQPGYLKATHIDNAANISGTLRKI
jgi:hypothetical protein